MYKIELVRNSIIQSVTLIKALYKASPNNRITIIICILTATNARHSIYTLYIVSNHMKLWHFNFTQTDWHQIDNSNIIHLYENYRYITYHTYKNTFVSSYT